MKTSGHSIIAALLLASTCACGQERPSTPASGAIQTPPGADPGIVKTLPANVDSQDKKSREDDCRGPAELCKQDSAR